MKIFHQIQKDCAIYGIGLNQPRIFNWRNRCAILIFICGNVFICAHMLCEVDAFQDYADSISTAAAPIAASIIFVLIVWRMRQIFNFVRETENLIDNREFDFGWNPFHGQMTFHANQAKHFRLEISRIKGHLRTIQSNHRKEHGNHRFHFNRNFLSNRFGGNVDCQRLYLLCYGSLSIAVPLLVCKHFGSELLCVYYPCVSISGSRLTGKILTDTWLHYLWYMWLNWIGFSL